MQIGIIGSGPIGSTLARHLAALGHDVLVANSRGPASLAQLEAETDATAATADEAAQARDIVIVAVPQYAVPRLPHAVLQASPALVIDTGNYYPTRDGRIADIDDGATESEWVARTLGRPVVKAFNQIVARSLATRGAPAGTPGRVALAIAGDDVTAKRTVSALVDALGFDTVDAGSLADSWRQQPGTPAYCHDLDAAALRDALAQAEERQIGACRWRADELAAAYFRREPPRTDG